MGFDAGVLLKFSKSAHKLANLGHPWPQLLIMPAPGGGVNHDAPFIGLAGMLDVR